MTMGGAFWSSAGIGVGVTAAAVLLTAPGLAASFAVPPGSWRRTWRVTGIVAGTAASILLLAALAWPGGPIRDPAAPAGDRAVLAMVGGIIAFALATMIGFVMALYRVTGAIPEAQFRPTLAVLAGTCLLVLGGYAWIVATL